LRAGAVLPARGPAIQNSGCEGGWYRINPRGFVCVGKGATLDVDAHPVVRASSVRAERGNALPYLYAMAEEDEPPHLYFRLPSRDEMKRSEGDDLEQEVAAWERRERQRGTLELLGELGPPPEFVTAGPLVKPYGTQRGLQYAAHAGRAAPDTGFALSRVFEWEGRPFALTTELDLVPLDRTRVVKVSAFQGVELGPGEELPVALVEVGETRSFKTSDGAREVAETFPRRSWIKLTGRIQNGLHETRSGTWVAAEGLRWVAARDAYPSFATGTRKWIDISINDQVLVAYAGRKAEFVTLVSTGRGGLADPEKSTATVRGTFMIHTKHVSATMDGDEDERADSYALKDVPFVQYFHEGYALHAAYWHDEFGKERSHGCVNLSPRDAAKLFEWTDPVVPKDWHSALNMERGTVVSVRP
jgi:hypothetical protein